MREKKLSSKNRFLAGLLAVVMIVGLLPAGVVPVKAAEETTYVLAGSDFQASSHDAGATIVSGLLDKIKVDYPTMNGFLFAGDYDVNYNDSANGKAKLQETVQAVYGTGMDEIYVQGNHDGDGLVGSTLTDSGANDAENYGVFVINEKDYMWNNDDEATIKKTAANLETYLNAKRNAGYTKPIFVVSHLPLHYCMRTQADGDGMHANYIFDVLNEAGAAGLNIIFMFGHNHSHGWDDPYGGAAIFLKKNDKINIAQNSKTVYQEETLNFTYMNAGYVSYYRNVNEGAETDLSMTVFAITDSDVTIERYTADGLHNLKSAGVPNAHACTAGDGNDSGGTCNHGCTEDYLPNTESVPSGYVMELSTEITPAGEEVEAPDSGNTGSGTATERTYTRVTNTSELVSGGQYLIIENRSTDYFMLPESISKDAGDRVGYNIEATSVAGGDTITGDYSAKEWTMTGSGNSWVLSTDEGSAYMEYQSSSRGYGRISATNSSTFTIGGSANAFTFATTTSNRNYVFDHSSAGLINGYVKTPDTTFYIYRLTDEGSSGPTVDTEGGDWVEITERTGGTTTYTYTQATSVTDGEQYVIVGNNHAIALMDNKDSMGEQSVTISGNTITSTTALTQWEFKSTTTESPWPWGEAQTTWTIYDKDGGRWLRYNNSKFELHASDSTDFTITDNGSNFRIRSGNRSFYYDGSNWTRSGNGTAQYVRLYQLTDTTTTGGTPGLYGKIDGELTYNVERGTSVVDALNKVKAGIDILYHYGDEKEAQTFPDDGDGMTWTLDSSYDGSTPGEYAVTIAYNGVTLGTAKVVVPSAPTVQIAGYGIEPKTATVWKGTNQAAEIGSEIIVTLEDGSFYKVPVTISMLSKNDEPVSTGTAGEFEGLTVTYNNVVITDDFTLVVQEKVQNNYPDYPNEGAVKVGKTTTGIDFQSSGVTQVELSVSGVPSKKGADVVVVIDTSSSMDNGIEGAEDGSSRIDILSASLEQMLLQFQKQNDDKSYPDIDLAVIDFNGYAKRIEGASLNNTYRDGTPDNAAVYTGVKDTAEGYDLISEITLSAGNFVPALDLNAEEFAKKFNEDRTSSGTNYDSGLDNAYKLLALKQQANGSEERDAFVIFLSDGAPFRYNGYENGGNSGYTNWDKWLSGEWEDKDDLVSEIASTNEQNAYPSFYNGNGESHPHRIAQAIKGTVGEPFDVVINTAADADPAYIQEYSGLGATIYSIGFGLARDGSSSKGYVEVDTMQNVLKAISSGDDYYYDVTSADQLTDAFTKIVSNINYAASNAHFEDQMGEYFDLQLVPRNYKSEGSSEYDETITPIIEVKEYTIITRQDYLNSLEDDDPDNDLEESQIGDRTGNSETIETITTTFSNKTDDVSGETIYTLTGVYSDKVDGNINILGADGVIRAKNFWYNTNKKTPTNDNAMMIDTNGDGTNDFSLPAETFYWNIGTVTTTEMAISYYVYLTGAMEGDRAAGSYATNEYATLYYTNYLGKDDCFKETFSPTTAWESANVSYAFYLVNGAGTPVNNNGDEVTFANRVAVTQPVLYEEILLNNLEKVSAIDVASRGVLPEGYDLYDSSARYTVAINSNSIGRWEIVQAKAPATTYVTGFSDTVAHSNSVNTSSDPEDIGYEYTPDYDYTHTTVWFAVVWTPKCVPDMVVIDYGLPVDAHVLGNDMFGDHGTLIGVTSGVVTGKASGDPSNQITTNTATGAYGTATVITTDAEGNPLDKSEWVIRYSPESKNMQMNGYDQFSYSVKYETTDSTGYYYGTLTVVPATTVYYEDSFVNFTNGTVSDNPDAADSTHGSWTSVGESDDLFQDEDRPGYFSLGTYDANNLYGYDTVNENFTTYSLGSAKKVTVSAFNNNNTKYSGGTGGSWPTASFTFTGTGFDLIGLTSNATGFINVKVEGPENYSWVVDTYYSMQEDDESVEAAEYPYMKYTWTKKADENAYEITAQEQLAELPAGVTLSTKTEINAGSFVVYENNYAWKIKEQTKDTLYQIPVVKSPEMTYGTYTVTVSVRYSSTFDHTGAGAYDFYLDAVRVYDPANAASDSADPTTNIITKAYVDDNEAWPEYFEIRNNLIAADDFAVNDKANGLIFIDGLGQADANNAISITDYTNFGPNNEVYLAKGQGIAFIANPKAKAGKVLANLELGAKVLDNSGVGVITVSMMETQGEYKKLVGDQYFTVNTATDMYYDIWDEYNAILTNSSSVMMVILNEGENLVSLTNIKSTYKNAPSTSEGTGSSGGSSGENSNAGGAGDSTAQVAMFYVDEPAALAATTYARAAYMTAIAVDEPEVFTPEKLSVSVEKVKKIQVGQKVAVTVTTSDDVDYIEVNGEKVTDYRTERRTGNRIWTVRIKAEEVGEMNVSVVAYSEDGVASQMEGTSTMVMAKADKVQKSANKSNSAKNGNNKKR